MSNNFLHYTNAYVSGVTGASTLCSILITSCTRVVWVSDWSSSWLDDEEHTCPKCVGIKTLHTLGEVIL
jgi:hypothetical protein